MKKVAREIRKNFVKVYTEFEFVDYLIGCVVCLLAMVIIKAIFGA